MIDIRNLSVKYKDTPVFTHLDVSISRGELCGLIGASGSGKTTLLNCIGTLTHPTSGTITIEGTQITKLSARKRRMFRKNNLGYLFQDYALIPDKSVYHNLKIAYDGDPSAIAPALEKVGLEGIEKREVHTLSGGQQQRVALARILLRKPSVILADEPTGALDHENAIMVMDHLVEFARAGAAVVVATHDDYVVSRCDSVFNISSGSSDTA